MRALMKQETDSIDFEMIYKKGRSLFYSIEKIDNSKLFQISMHEVFRKSQGEFFYDNATRKAENKKESNGQPVIISYGFDEIKWEITDKTEIINDRLCRIAVHRRIEEGRNGPREMVTVAWVDETHPQDIAPFGLVGLKGLIVKVNFNNNYEALLDTISTKKNKKIAAFKSGKRISLKDYYAALEQLMQERRNRGS